MPFVSRYSFVATAALFIALAACSSANLPAPQNAPAARMVVQHGYSVGPIVQPKLKGTILSYDIDQHGSDGLLADYNGRSFRVSLETFDQTTGKITKVVREGSSEKINYGVGGIFAHDVGFVADKKYQLMNPVTGEKLNETWTPPVSFEVTQVAENQSTPEQAMLGYDSAYASLPTAVIAADVTKGAGKLIPLDQTLFSSGAIPVIAQDPATDQAVVGATDGGRTTQPTFGIIDLRTGKTTTFKGLGDGDVDGIGIDSKTDTMCTTTGDDAGVEFYDLKTETGFEVQLPNSGGSELHSGAGVAVDSIHGLCIVAQPVSGEGTQASAIWVVDEKGDFLEEIQGFNFWFDVGPVINPAKRIGFVENPRPEYGTLTGFSY